MISHEEKMASLSPERRARIQARAEESLKEIRAIRELRSHLGLIQEEFAERVGESQSRISRLENGSRGLTLEDFSSFVRSLGGEWELTVKLPELGAIQVMGSSDFPGEPNCQTSTGGEIEFAPTQP
jgi:transcriptional regulator with XRE-family HTH domain